MSYGISPRLGNSVSFLDRAMNTSDNAINARSRMQPGSKTETEAAGATVAGGVSAAAGGAAAGGAIGSAIAGGEAGSTAGPWGAAIGAVVGLVAYLASS